MPSAPFNAWPPASPYPTVMLRVTLSVKWLTKYCATCTTPAVNPLGAEPTLESQTTLIERPVPEPLFTNVELLVVVVPPPGSPSTTAGRHHDFWRMRRRKIEVARIDHIGRSSEGQGWRSIDDYRGRRDRRATDRNSN